MIYNVKNFPRFDNELKRLAKKYPSLKGEYEALVEELEKNPEIGTPLGQSKIF
jgi:mRNA-degrading endonuclease RelE of RelBE toxin-antitoxin system